MTRNKLNSMIESGRPFSVTMSDGGVFEVPHRDYISLHPKEMYAIVYEDDGKFHILSFRNMTTISSSDKDAA